MRNFTLRNLLAYAVLLVFVLESCKDDSNLKNLPAVADQSFVEEFDTLSAAIGRGWVIKNKSEPIGTENWEQDGASQFINATPAYSSTSTSNGCLMATYFSAHNENDYEGLISNWLISPALTLQNDDKIIFYTKTDDNRWGDRLQLWINTANDGTEVGSALSTGDFTVKLLDINPLNYSSDSTNAVAIPVDLYKYDPAAVFPENWTRFEAKVRGLTKPTRGRFAFRYYVPSGGDAGMGSAVFIDSVAYKTIGY